MGEASSREGQQSLSLVITGLELRTSPRLSCAPTSPARIIQKQPQPLCTDTGASLGQKPNPFLRASDMVRWSTVFLSPKYLRREATPHPRRTQPPLQHHSGDPQVA